MNRRIRRVPSRSFPRSNAGSILILTLLLVGVLAISVAAMLGSVRHLVRNADDRIAEEECYHTAMAGLNTTKAWLMRADMATTQTGATIAGALQQITSGALDLSNYVINEKKVPEVIENLSLADVEAFFSSRVPGYSGQPVPGESGRRTIIYEWGGGTDKPMVIRRGIGTTGKFTAPLFNVPLGNDARSWVERIRITTPYRGEGTPPKDNLRMTSLIIEVEAKTVGAGVEKTRVLSGRVLVIPQREWLPPAQSGAAILSGAIVDIGGNSPLQVHWGPIWSKGNLKVLGVSYDKGNVNQANPSASIPPTLTFDTGTGTERYTGVGNEDPFGYPEKWLRYHAGINPNGTPGLLLNKQNNPIFAGGAGSNNAPVRDFFVQLANHEFTHWTTGRWDTPVTGDPTVPPQTATTADDITSIGVRLRGLTPDYVDGPEQVDPETGEVTDPGGRARFLPGGEDTPYGALAQGIPEVNVMIDKSFDSLDYATWKNFAIANKGYVRPAGNYFVNATGQRLYVTPQRTLTVVDNGNPFTDLKQLSMKALLPADGNTAALPDRILFIDTIEGTENGTRVEVKFNSSTEFFWKGMIFINGDVVIGGAGQMPTIWAKNPDEYNISPPDKDSKGLGNYIERCFLDGILRVTGRVTKQGNPALYGSIVVGNRDSQASFGSGGGPEVFYNPRCKDGLFRDPQDPLEFGIVSGPIVELASYD